MRLTGPVCDTSPEPVVQLFLIGAHLYFVFFYSCYDSHGDVAFSYKRKIELLNFQQGKEKKKKTLEKHEEDFCRGCFYAPSVGKVLVKHCCSSSIKHTITNQRKI